MASQRLSSPIGFGPMAPPCGKLAPQAGKSQAAGSTIGRSTRTCHSDDASAPCFASAGCEVCRNSPPFTHSSRTTSTRNAASVADPNLRPAEPPLLPRGAVSARDKGQLHCPSGDWFELVCHHPTLNFPRQHDHFSWHRINWLIPILRDRGMLVVPIPAKYSQKGPPGAIDLAVVRARHDHQH